MSGMILCLIFLSLSACQSKPLFDPSLAHRSIHPELHIGEYSIPVSSKEIITFSRGPKEPTGLIKVNTETGVIEVLDGNAKNARDLVLENSWLYYLIENSLYRKPLDTSAGSVIQKISTEIEKLKGVVVIADTEFLLVKKDTGGDFLICRKGESPEYKAHLLSQQGVSLRSGENGNALLFIETKSGLYLAEANCENGFSRSGLVEVHARSNYARFYQDRGSSWLAYLQEEKGTLQMVEFDPKTLKIKENLKAAGKEFESYVGMDIAFFSDTKKPGIFFLNGQTLKLHWTRWKNGKWNEEALKVAGAVGFYNTVLEKKKETVTISTHAFRAINTKNDYSFEDLLLVDLDLR